MHYIHCCSHHNNFSIYIPASKIIINGKLFPFPRAYGEIKSIHLYKVMSCEIQLYYIFNIEFIYISGLVKIYTKKLIVLFDDANIVITISLSTDINIVV